MTREFDDDLQAYHSHPADGEWHLECDVCAELALTWTIETK